MPRQLEAKSSKTRVNSGGRACKLDSPAIVSIFQSFCSLLKSRAGNSGWTVKDVSGVKGGKIVGALRAQCEILTLRVLFEIAPLTLASFLLG